MNVRRSLALLAAAATLAVSCSSDSVDDSASDPEVPESIPEALAAEESVVVENATAGTQIVSALNQNDPTVDLDLDAILAADLSGCIEYPAGEPIRVGVASDYSTISGFVDIPGSQAIAYVADKINCSGGINGQPVEVRVLPVEDDAGQAAKDLLEWGADILVGPPFDEFAFPILLESGDDAPVFVAASTEAALANGFDNSFLVSFDDLGMSSAAAQWAWDEGITRAIVFTEGEGVAYSGVNPDAFMAKFEELGGEIVSIQPYVWIEDLDFSVQAAEIASLSENNEVVFSAAIADQVTAMRGVLEAEGLDGLTYLGVDVLGPTGITELPNNEGITWTSHTFISPGDRIDTLLSEYEEDRGEALGAAPFMPLYIDSMLLGLQGAIDCSCTDGSQIGAAVSQIEGFEGLSGQITYTDTVGIPPKDVPITQIVDGQVALVTTISGDN